MVRIADREGGIYEIYKEANNFHRAGKAHYLIRAKTDKRVCGKEGEKTEYRLKSALRSEKPLGQLVLEISEANKRKARTAHLTVYSKKLFIGLPDKFKKGPGYKPLPGEYSMLSSWVGSVPKYPVNVYLAKRSGKQRMGLFTKRNHPSFRPV